MVLDSIAIPLADMEALLRQYVKNKLGANAEVELSEYERTTCLTLKVRYCTQPFTTNF